MLWGLGLSKMTELYEGVLARVFFPFFFLCTNSVNRQIGRLSNER